MLCYASYTNICFISSFSRKRKSEEHSGDNSSKKVRPLESEVCHLISFPYDCLSASIFIFCSFSSFLSSLSLPLSLPLSNPPFLSLSCTSLFLCLCLLWGGKNIAFTFSRHFKILVLIHLWPVVYADIFTDIYVCGKIFCGT